VHRLKIIPVFDLYCGRILEYANLVTLRKKKNAQISSITMLTQISHFFVMKIISRVKRLRVVLKLLHVSVFVSKIQYVYTIRYHGQTNKADGKFFKPWSLRICFVRTVQTNTCNVLTHRPWRWTIQKNDLLYYTFRAQILSMRSTRCLDIRD